MAKKQRGSTRTSTRPPAPASNRPSGQRPAGSGSSSSSSFDARRATKSSAKGGGSRRLSPALLVTIGAVVVGLVIVVIAVANQPKASTTDALVTPGGALPASIPIDGRTMGQAAAPATVDLYGDFRCSACYNFTEMGTEQKLVNNDVATGRARIVWHDYLTIDRADGKTASRDAANAAWCAADQGKFWTMHDWLYANQSPSEDASAFTKERLAAIGKAAGLDMAAYQPCLDAGTHDSAITAEQSGAPADVSGTPTVIVNGKLVGAQGTVPTYDEIKAAIDAVAGPSGAPASSVAPSG